MKTLPFALAAIILLLSFSSCTSLNAADPTWRRITCYNNSDKPICVTSITGISAYTKGKGPQDLGVGNMKPNALASNNTMNALYIEYPVLIRWVNNFVESSSPGWGGTDASANHQSIQEFHGLDPNVKSLHDESCLLLVFTGGKWDAYYISGKSRLSRDEINSLIKGRSSN